MNGFKPFNPSGSVPSDNLTGGFMVYNDLATTGTPLVHVGGIDTPLTNDELGSQTLKTFRPNGVTDVWDASSDMFDFSELSNGDMVDIRIDINVTTSSPDQEIFINLELGQGGSPFVIPFAHDIYKSTGARPIGSYKGIYMGDDNIRLNGGQFIFSSTGNATIIVNGWYCKILKR